MDSLSQTPPQQWIPPEGPKGTPSVKGSFTQLGSWLGTRPGRITLLGIVFLLGIVIGIAAIFLYVLSIAGDASPILVQPSPQSGAIVVQVSNAYISQLIQKNVQSAGLPETVQNIHV